MRLRRCGEARGSEPDRECRDDLTPVTHASRVLRQSDSDFRRLAETNFLWSSLLQAIQCTGKVRDRGTRSPDTRDACATRNQIVAHEQDHNSGSSSDFARFSTRSAFIFGRITAKIVDPDPDINAAPTSGCFSNHTFTCARKTNFSKTARSKSFTKVMSPNFCD